MSVTPPSNGYEVIAYLDSMNRSGLLHNSRTTDGIMIGSLSVAFIDSLTTCESSIIQHQNISVNCENLGIGNDVLNSRGCQECLKQVQHIIEQRAQLIYESDLPDEMFSDEIKSTVGIGTGVNGEDRYEFGICKYACQQCVLENVNQTIDVHLDSNFDQLCNMPDFQNAFATGLTNQLLREFQQQDTVASTLNTTNEDMTGMLVSMITSSIDVQSFLVNVYQGLLTSQNIRIGQGSTSLYIRDMTQTINFSQVFSVITEQYSNIRSNMSTQISIVNVAELEQINTEYFASLVDDIRAIAVDSGISIGIIAGGTIVIWIITIICIIIIYSINIDLKKIVEPVNKKILDLRNWWDD